MLIGPPSASNVLRISFNTEPLWNPVSQTSKGNENWLKKSGGLRNQGFAKSVFYCKLMLRQMNMNVFNPVLYNRT